jgi:hypothetical protein
VGSAVVAHLAITRLKVRPRPFPEDSSPSTEPSRQHFLGAGPGAGDYIGERCTNSLLVILLHSKNSSARCNRTDWSDPHISMNVATEALTQVVRARMNRFEDWRRSQISACHLPDATRECYTRKPKALVLIGFIYLWRGSVERHCLAREQMRRYALNSVTPARLIRHLSLFRTALLKHKLNRK